MTCDVDVWQECLIEEQPELKGRALATALKKKAREIWSQATREQRLMYERIDIADAALPVGAAVGDKVQHGDDDDDGDDLQDPDFVEKTGVKCTTFQKSIKLF